MEPIILELEREQNDLLIIAHESVLRVLYGYLMACDAMNIPTLKFPRNEIIEVCIFFFFPSLPPILILSLISYCPLPPLLLRIQNKPQTNPFLLSQIIPASYQNEAKRIHIDGLAPEIIPGSPEDIRIPVPPSRNPSTMPSGVQSPFDSIGTPALGAIAGVDTEESGVVTPMGEELGGGE